MMLDRAYNYWVHEQNDGIGCQRCSLHEGANTVVFGSGRPDAKLLIIGEAPGEQEDRFGDPFIGPAGQLLRVQASLVGVDFGVARLSMRSPETGTHFVTHGCAYWTNVVGCRPPNNRIPMFNEIGECRTRLEMIVAALRPTIILSLGNVPLTPLTGKTGITRTRGTWQTSRWKWKSEIYLVPVMPTFHPAGLLPNRIKSPNDLGLFRQDILAAYKAAYPNGWDPE
jgi:DNA polymerase